MERIHATPSFSQLARLCPAEPSPAPEVLTHRLTLPDLPSEEPPPGLIPLVGGVWLRTSRPLPQGQPVQISLEAPGYSAPVVLRGLVASLRQVPQSLEAWSLIWFTGPELFQYRAFCQVMGWITAH